MNSLEKKFGKRLKKGVSLAKYTSFRIGGKAEYFLAVKTGEELMEAVGFAKKDGIDYVLLGGGSNVLVNDAGVSGLVIKLSITSYEVSKKNITARAGLTLRELSKLASENSLTGLEWANGVPGTVGGACVMNAGCFGREMKDFLVKVKYFDGKNIKELAKRQCRFGYRESIFKENPEWIVLEAEFKLKKGDKKKIIKQVKDYLDMRNERLPLDYPSAGSVFKKYEIKKAEKLNLYLEKIIKKEHPEFLAGHYIPAGWLIEELDLCGKKIGGAMVSVKHGNFIVNIGKAKAEEVIMLISMIKQKVRNHFGIQLAEEVIYLGFD